MNSSLPETIRRTQTIGSYIISVSDGPGVYRHIRISQDASLQDLSRIIQQSFGLREGKVPSFIIQPPGRGRELVKYGRNQAGPMLAMRQVRLRDSGLAEARWAQYCMDKPRVAWNCRVKSLLDEPTPEPQILYTSGDFHNLRYKLSEMKTKRRQLAQERARALSEAVLLSDLSDDTARLMVDYILAAANFYGVVPISLVHDMFCRQQRQVNYAAFALFCLDISQAEDSRCHLLDEDWQLVDPDADANGPFVFIASARVVDHWQMPAIKRMQQGKPWYIPKPGMLLPYREEGYVPKSPEYEALRLAIQALKPSAEALDGILQEVVEQTLLGEDGTDAVFAHIQAGRLATPTFAQLRELSERYAQYANNSRMYVNCGHTPYEIASIFGRPPLAPVIPFPTEQAKPGRNAPCPCGSGKKHKHCCGKI